MQDLEIIKNSICQILSYTFFKSSFNNAKELITVLHDNYGYLVSNDLILHRTEECHIKIDSHKKILSYASINDINGLIGYHKIYVEFITDLLNIVSEHTSQFCKNLASSYRYLVYYDKINSIDLLFLLDRNKRLFNGIKNKENDGYILINSKFNSSKLITLEELNFKTLLNLFEELKPYIKDDEEGFMIDF